MNVNGQRTSNNSVTLDGVNVNDFNLAHFDTIPLPNPNTIQDFKVATSLYDASSGSKGGGALAGNILLRLAQKERALTEYEEYLRLAPKGEFAPQARGLTEKLKTSLGDGKKN